MGYSRDDDWETNYEVYSDAQVQAVLEECRIEVISETGTHFLCLCPFHGNTYSPAFAIDKMKGLFTCFNQSCGASGKLEDLPRRLLGKNIFQSKRIILKHANAQEMSFEEKLEALQVETEYPEWSEDANIRMHADFWGSPAEEYMHGRGFNDETLKHFKVGYSAKKNLVSVPMYLADNTPVGVIGRSLEDKQFKNSKGLPKKEIPWNFNNARTTGDSVIVCEASFDAMRIHQAGYANVIAVLGGHFTPWHQDLLNKTFSKIIIMSDYDERKVYPNCAKCRKAGHSGCQGHRPGRDLGRQIADALPNKRILWAAYDDTCVYPNGAKDACNMTDDEIRQCLRNAISNFEYSLWNIEDVLA